MKIDEQEFRSFIANLESYIMNSDRWVYSERTNQDYNRLENLVENQVEKYKEMLEAPKPSRWKQLKLIENDNENK